MKPQFIGSEDGTLVRTDAILTIGPEDHGTRTCTLADGSTVEIEPAEIERLTRAAPLQKATLASSYRKLVQ